MGCYKGLIGFRKGLLRGHMRVDPGFPTDLMSFFIGRLNGLPEPQKQQLV